MRLRRALGVALALLVAGCGAGVIPPIRSEAERLEAARRLVREREYAAAIELLKTYLQNNAGSAQVDEAIYLLGESYLRTKDYGSATAEFERLLRDYPESDSSAAGAFRIAETYFSQARPPAFDQEQTVRAVELWQAYLRDYPGHWMNEEARRRVAIARTRLATKDLNTAKLYLKLDLPDPARVYFQRVIDEYGDTPVVGEAWIGLALADARAGRKREAVDRLRALEEQFAGQPIATRAAKERQRLER